MTIGMIGTGAMGRPMAERLLKAGFDFSFYARRKEVVAHLEGCGGKSCSIRELGERCEVVLLILNSYPQCRECAEELLQTMKSGCVVVHSTISPKEMEALAELCAAHGVELLAAPMTGGVAGAKNGTLTLIVGGSAARLEQLRPVFSVLGTNIVHTGETVDSASTMKLLVQLLVGINTAATAEALVLGAKSGLDPELVYSTICASAGVSKIFTNRGNTMIARDFATRGTLSILHKDLRYCIEKANETECTLPLGQTVNSIFQLGLNTLPDPSEDFSAIVKVYEAWAGVSVGGGKD